ncbi:Imm9 family immunity protein [Flavobacterium branchiophilum]|uniref:Uncharacterized protein n=1 Tax=Flavobacterium branchiophilum TaxID=55197 RepID=A0A2H3K8F2_9FLAO|nr:Imm9 family immunity protein [Flavobacterium branchiophilum]PDS21950.1 hypothetical protein B0A77_14705 [Flavobacterium branchiophilum]
MKDIIISHSSYVFRFVDEEFITKDLYYEYIDKIKEILETNKIILPDGWLLIFNLIYTNGRVPLLTKNRSGGFRSDKMKEISIVAPIPLKEEIEWGIDIKDHFFKKEHYDKIINNFWELDIDYKNYNTSKDYITACLKEGIRKAFEIGFTVGGLKINVKDISNL